MMAPMQLLLEIGTEELPPSLLGPITRELARRVASVFSEQGLTIGPTDEFWTPRRIAVRFDDVPAAKPAAEIEIQGPPRSAAFDSAGRPTRVALGFSAAQGVNVEDFFFKTTPRGEYVYVRRRTPAVPVAELLAAKLPAVIRSLPSPKLMRWDASGTGFARPIRWLVCILGNEPVRFRFGATEADAITVVHRNAQPRTRRLSSPAEYESELLAGFVIASHAKRRALIAAELARLAAEIGGQPVSDDELLEETADVTEYPVLLRGSFRAEHLVLPDVVLITALKKHQRCFSLRSADGKLLPAFVAVANSPQCDRTAVAAWYEKAIESRLRDARFFYEADVARGLQPLVEAERQVVWMEGLGNLFDKTERLRALCRFLSNLSPAVDPEQLDRAALLCKADLLTDMIREKEFTSLQGIIGGIYARLGGEPATVCQAIAEHYLPNFAGDQLPATPAGALLSIADKADNIIAGFIAGAAPTGSEDPFALRRQAAGILAIAFEHGLPLDLTTLINTALKPFTGPDAGPAELVSDFFRERTAQALTDRGVPYDITNAVLVAFASRPVTALSAAQALIRFRGRPEFEQLVIGQKRVANILKGQSVTGEIEPALLGEPAEQELWRITEALAPRIDTAITAGDFDTAFELLLSLRTSIDRFFTEVLVMTEDQPLRLNRLRLLNLVRSLFSRVADLSRIVINDNPER